MASIKNILERQATLQRELQPISERYKALEATTAIQKAIAEASSTRQELLRAVAGSVVDLRRAGAMGISEKFTDHYKDLRDMIAETEKRYRLPALLEASKLVHEIENFSVVRTAALIREQHNELTRAMAEMQSPWLDIENKMRSVSAFAELQYMGHTLRSSPAFGSVVTNALRSELGDWRDKVTWPQEIFVDPVARSGFYVNKGLNQDLTAFPEPAFEESMLLAGLGQELPPLNPDYETNADNDDEETGLIRTNAAHGRLLRFETQVRRFIDARMTQVFGEMWIKHRVPPSLYEKWIVKREKAQQNGENGWALIAYADFTDYVPIITRKDNWKDVFEPVFKRPELVRESFQRLYPIRICTMHARLITLDDELYLRAETIRILNAMGI